MLDEDMNMAARLLAIIYSTVKADGSYVNDEYPFTLSDCGAVRFSAPIQDRLNLPENGDLIDWAHSNAKSLL